MARPSMIICMPRSFSSQRFVARISSRGPLGTDGTAPVDRRAGVPLVLLGRLVEHFQLVMGGLVVVIPERLELVGHAPPGRLPSRRHPSWPPLNGGSAAPV